MATTWENGCRNFKPRLRSIIWCLSSSDPLDPAILWSLTTTVSMVHFQTAVCYNRCGDYSNPWKVMNLLFNLSCDANEAITNSIEKNDQQIKKGHPDQNALLKSKARNSSRNFCFREFADGWLGFLVYVGRLLGAACSQGFQRSCKEVQLINQRSR